MITTDNIIVTRSEGYDGSWSLWLDLARIAEDAGKTVNIPAWTGEDGKPLDFEITESDRKTIVSGKGIPRHMK